MFLACPNCAITYEVNAAVIGDGGRSLRCARCQVVWYATRAQELVVAVQPVEAVVSAEPETRTADSAPVASAPFVPENVASDPPAASPEPALSEHALPEQTIAAENSAPFIDAPPIVPAAPEPPPEPGTKQPVSRGEDIETFARRRAESAAARSRRLRAQFGPPAVILILALIITALVAWRTNIVRMAPQMASLYGSIGLPVNLRELVFGSVRTAKEARDGVPVLLVEGSIKSTSKHAVEVPRLRFALRNQAGQEIYSWTAMPEHSILAPGATLPFRSRLASPPSEGHDVVVRFFTRRDAIEGAR
jgi:predicted Zn finger-like uncharacterized protein